LTSIYVDADACPVKDAIITVALRHNCKTFMVCNGGIRPHPHDLIELVIVPASADAADMWIAQNCGANDIVITNDIPLAEACVKSDSIVLKPNGTVLDKQSIGGIVATRDLMSDIRASDPFHISKSKPFSASDKGRFSQRLDELLHKKR